MLTVPSIVVSVVKSKNKALMKESIQAINQIVQEGVLDGDFSEMSSFDIQSPSSPLVQYFTTRLQGINCAKDSLDAPCDHVYEYTTKDQVYNNHSARWVLNNGVKISFHSSWNSTTYLNFFIDVKPTATSKYGVVDGDQFWLFCNISDAPLTMINYFLLPKPMNPAQCGPVVRYNYVGQFDALFR